MTTSKLLKLLEALDVAIISNWAVCIGLFFICLGYVFNAGLIKTLQANLGKGKTSVLGTVTNNKLLITDNVTSRSNFIWSTPRCIYISSNSKILQSEKDYLALVTPNFGYAAIPEYNDLVYLRKFDIDTYEFTRLRKEPAQALSAMNKELRSIGINPFITSGYRMLSDQIKNVENWNSIVGTEKAKSLVARPGYSEHHLGTTVDILSVENDLNLQPSYEKTKLSKWLKRNAYRFGFIMSYPDGSEGTTGYAFEPWHYRYIGIELASELYANGMILQDYLYQRNNYCLVAQ